MPGHLISFHQPTLNLVPISPIEMAIYVGPYRYALRTDGFASLNAGYEGGEMTTKPFTFVGGQLALNFSTSAAGSVGVEIQDANRDPIPGFALRDCPEIVGDEIERIVTWRGGHDVSQLAGKPIRLRFVMTDADLYALRFG